MILLRCNDDDGDDEDDNNDCYHEFVTLLNTPVSNVSTLKRHTVLIGSIVSVSAYQFLYSLA